MEIKENFLQYSPILYLVIIADLVKARKYRNRTDFVNEAIKEKLEKEGIDLEPHERSVFEPDWDTSDYFPKTNKKRAVL